MLGSRLILVAWYKKSKVIPRFVLKSCLHGAVYSGGRGGLLAGIGRLPHGTFLLFQCMLPTEWISNHSCKYHPKKELKYRHNHFYSPCCAKVSLLFHAVGKRNKFSKLTRIIDSPSPEATPIKCASRESAGLPALSHTGHTKILVQGFAHRIGLVLMWASLLEIEQISLL